MLNEHIYSPKGIKQSARHTIQLGQHNHTVLTFSRYNQTYLTASDTPRKKENLRMHVIVTKIIVPVSKTLERITQKHITTARQMPIEVHLMQHNLMCHILPNTNITT